MILVKKRVFFSKVKRLTRKIFFQKKNFILLFSKKKKSPPPPILRNSVRNLTRKKSVKISYGIFYFIQIIS